MMKLCDLIDIGVADGGLGKRSIFLFNQKFLMGFWGSILYWVLSYQCFKFDDYDDVDDSLLFVGFICVGHWN